ncbi:hypothetical protein [Cupriavidus sp. USMAA2-4]|uniref:hypothetical protein n=1 Tax=Cupriavidus sp. USMAA2-4 TaxID=876364 RepID=UPI000A06A631|nr:hypothetical protein [Cupriavidus sp. USMAA2-4]
MREQLWTVVRFPNGSWSYGGKPTDPDYALCETWQVPAFNAKDAVKKAQSIRSRARRKLAAMQAQD